MVNKKKYICKELFTVSKMKCLHYYNKDENIIIVNSDIFNFQMTPYIP